MPYRFTDAFEILDYNSRKVKLVRGPDLFEAIFTSSKINDEQYMMEENDKTKRAFTGAALTNRHIYLSYSGNLSLNPDSYNANTILVYDWEGNPLRKIVFKDAFLNFTVSENDETLYAYNPHTGYVVKASLE